MEESWDDIAINTYRENFFKPIILMEEEKKICTPQHSINGYVPQKNDFQYHGQTCDCKKIIFAKVNTCGCPAQSATYELQARPSNQ